MKIKLSIIIVSYNVKNKLNKCLKKIIDYPSSEIIIIDNNSEDGTYKYLITNLSKKIKIVKNECNLGFSKAVNQGIKIAQGEYILLLNPDTIPSKESILELIKFSEKKSLSHKVGFVGGKMIHPQNSDVQGTFVNRPNFMTALFEFTNLRKLFKNNIYSRSFYYKDVVIDKPFEVFALSGGFLLFKKEIIDRIGFFDENFFMYLEDVDLGLRAKSLGYSNFFVPSSVIYHNGGESSSKSPYKINVKAWRYSKKYFFKKYSNNFISSFILYIVFSIDDLLNDIKHIIFREPLS